MINQNEKYKSENYSNFGGMNVKVSTYTTGPTEFLNLVNFDFQMPGALTKRWGSTQYVGQGLTGKIAGLYEYNQINGFSQIIAFGGTFGYYVTGSSLTPFNDGVPGVPYGSNGHSIIQQLGFSLNYSTINFVNNVFIRYDGVSSYFYGLPQFSLALLGLGSFVGYSTQPVVGSSGVGVTETPFRGMTGIYYYQWGYLNNRGFLGPATPAAGGITTMGTTNVIFRWGDGASRRFEAGYGITALAFYRAGPFGENDYSSFSLIPNNLFGLIGYLPGNSATFVDSNLVASSVTFAPQCMAWPIWDPSASIGFPPPFIPRLGSNPGLTLCPSYLEIYNNQLAMAGFSAVPSTVYISDLAEPESVQPDNFFEVRTNDGDKITAMKAYNSKLYIFKFTSMHAISGDDPDNFQLTQISDTYGCVHFRASAVYKDYLVFLDRKGAIRYDGSNFVVISNKVQPEFDNMNIEAARVNAFIVHDKERHQIVIAFPTGTSTINNKVMVYDYVMDAWTKHEGYVPNLSIVATGALTKPSMFTGSYTGMIYNFGETFLSDNGVAYTALLQTRFLSDLGQTTQKMFRRLYLNVDPVTGSTSGFTLSFYQDYGSSIILSNVMYQNPFQSRIDYGISARSMAFTLTNTSAVDSVRLHGFTIEYRFLRDT